MTNELPSIIKDYETQKALVSELETQSQEIESKITKKFQEFVGILQIQESAARAGKESNFLNRFFERTDEELCKMDTEKYTLDVKLEIETEKREDLITEIMKSGWEYKLIHHGDWLNPDVYEWVRGERQ